MSREGPRMERAGRGVSLLFSLAPPVAGSVLGGLFLTHDERVPVVLVGSVAVALLCALSIPWLGRRSRGFRNALFSRLTELAVLAGLTATALIVYTLVIYVLLDVRTPWALELLQGVLPG